MTTVRYRCPLCGAIVAMEREGYLADKCVTPYPLSGWVYVSPDDDVGSSDGVRFVCGESEGVSWEGEGCGDPFYLSFVRYEGGQEVEPVPESEHVKIGGPGPRGPRGPRGPPGPG